MAQWGRGKFLMLRSALMRSILCITLVAQVSACSELALGKQGAPDTTIVNKEVLPASRPNVENPPIRGTGTYRAKPGDSLFVFVFDNPDLTRTVIVAPDGSINYPLVGALNVQGLTFGAIDNLITERLARNILQPEVTVTLAEIAAEQIFVTGEVISPGVFDIKEQVSVVQAISMAGGFTAFAELSNIIVYNPARVNGARRVFNYEAFLADPSGFDIALSPGDTVIVQ
jgi:polysaccharide export outer membrane protein